LNEEINDITRRFATYAEWRGNREIVTGKLQDCFTEARDYLTQIEIQEHNYADRYLMQSHKGK